MHHSPWIARRSQTQKLSEPSPLGFFWGLHYIGMIKSLATDDWFNLRPLSSPQRSGDGTKSSNPLIEWWLYWQPAPILRNFPKVIIHITTRTFITRYLGNFKGFGSSVPEQGGRPNTYFLLKLTITQQVFEKTRYTPVLGTSAISWFSKMYGYVYSY